MHNHFHFFFTLNILINYYLSFSQVDDVKDMYSAVVGFNTLITEGQRFELNFCFKYSGHFWDSVEQICRSSKAQE